MSKGQESTDDSLTSLPRGGTTQSPAPNQGLGLGTAPVFLASISTILGAILFLRFGYTVGHVGLMGALLIIVIGHLVTMPTALAIAEIATNRRVEGGGEYFIISRSFGSTIGASIGIALYFSQAISVAFYMIAFAEAFQPLSQWVEQWTGMAFDPRMISLPGALILLVLIITRGANIGVTILWVVVSILGVSLVMFFLGSPIEGVSTEGINLFATVEKPDMFFLVFAIVFPAFTGMTAGVGLSGDLANPRRSIPLGILSATVVGMMVYFAVIFKLAASATPEMLAEDQLIMARIAVWGPIIPIGLACASLSSVIGSILVAPRTLQALAADRFVSWTAITRFFAKGTSLANEPRNATLITGMIAVIFIAVGNINFVAKIISMFFMVTYGSLCAISFLEHFAARPSYRPTFRSKWYISLLGAVACLLLMFQMNPAYALLSILAMVILYRSVCAAQKEPTDDLASIFKGVMIQATRYMQVKLQKNIPEHTSEQWRPSIIMVNERTFERSSPLQMLTWLCHRHGVGTYLHFVQGPLDADHYAESQNTLNQLIQLIQSRNSSVYVDTIISPSMRSALAQSLQVPGISGMENNTVLFEFSAHDPKPVRQEVIDGCFLADATHMDILVLRHGDRFFGCHGQIHIWLTWHDYRNANLMVILAYIILGNPDWRDAEIQIFAAVPEAKAELETRQLQSLIASGRIPVSLRNLTIIPTAEDVNFSRLVEAYSTQADLVIFGFTMRRLEDKGLELFQRHPALGDVMFVAASQRIEIK